MIAVGEQHAGRQGVYSTMRKRKHSAPEIEREEHGGVGNGAKREDRAKARHASDLGGEKPAAISDFARFGFVLRWNAANRISDAGPAKLEAVVNTGRIGTLGKAEFT